MPFARTDWPGRTYRVVAVRNRDRLSGKQIFLWKDLDFTVQIFITNEWHEALEDVARRYDLRAGIEPLIGELKHAWAMGKVPSHCFAANHAATLLKLLAFNLLRPQARVTVSGHTPSSSNSGSCRNHSARVLRSTRDESPPAACRRTRAATRHTRTHEGTGEANLPAIRYRDRTPRESFPSTTLPSPGLQNPPGPRRATRLETRPELW